MNRLQLATLIFWAGNGGMQGRKRLQKVAYLLQQAGCPLDCRFTLHHYGPYSRDVADVCDEMVTADLLCEAASPAYVYTLTPRTQKLLEGKSDASMQKFQELGKGLISEDLWLLELGSTILLFFRQGNDWEDALKRACGFKKVSADAETSRQALDLAKRVQAEAVT